MVSRRIRRARRAAAALVTAALVVSGLVASTVMPGNAETTSASGATATAHTITYDQYSLMIDGQRTMIWSGEFHYWRLPSIPGPQYGP